MTASHRVLGHPDHAAFTDLAHIVTNLGWVVCGEGEGV